SNRAAVFTMGALHEGHAALMKAARGAVGATGEVVVSIFVNPTQFNDPKDFAKYPQNLDADLAICEAAGVDLVFAPTVDEMYRGEIPEYSAHALGGILEGEHRPGHFDAVATVVARLLELTKPAHTFFGEKDYQQLVVIRRLVAELRLPVVVHPVKTVRAESGLALSSRNQRLSPQGFNVAASLGKALAVTCELLQAGDSIENAKAAGLKILQSEDIKLDYFEVCDVDLNVATESTKVFRVLLAAIVEGVRLIDNMEAVRN
ncbi:MAG: hypothetical protein RL038_998, partial [Actinomycetota bacterium]